MNDSKLKAAEKVRELRAKAGYSMRRLAGLADLSLSTIQSIEISGVISRRSAERLAAVLGCKPIDLLPKNERSAK